MSSSSITLSGLPSNCYSDSSNKLAICLSNAQYDTTCINTYNNSKKGDIIISDYYEYIGNNWSCNNSLYNCNIKSYNNCTNTLTINDNNKCIMLSNSSLSSPDIFASVSQENILCIDINTKKITPYVSNDKLSLQPK
jgi:hypothetical protein